MCTYTSLATRLSLTHPVLIYSVILIFLFSFIVTTAKTTRHSIPSKQPPKTVRGALKPGLQLFYHCLCSFPSSFPRLFCPQKVCAVQTRSNPNDKHASRKFVPKIRVDTQLRDLSGRKSERNIPRLYALGTYINQRLFSRV